MLNEKTLIPLVIGLLSALTVSVINGDSSEVIATEATKSLISNPAEPALIAIAYSFGFICHAKTTERFFQAMKESNYRQMEDTEMMNRTCFKQAKTMVDR